MTDGSSDENDFTGVNIVNPLSEEISTSMGGIEDLTLADHSRPSDRVAGMRERPDLPEELEELDLEGVGEDFNYSSFQKAVEAVERMDHWNPSPLNGYEEALNLHQSSYGENTGETTYGKILDQETAKPTKLNTFRGEAGQLSVTERGELLPSTEMEYGPAEDARPESEHFHGVLMHAAGVLAQYEAETEGEGITVGSLDAREAEEVARAYTVIDSALTSESFDQRTTVEQLEDMQQENPYTMSRPDGYELFDP